MGEGRRESYGDQPATDSTTDQEAGRKLTVSEAAKSLGISPDAVRSRIKRKTLPTVREGGRVLVVMGATDRPINQDRPTKYPDEDRLYEEMSERIRYLERQVEEEREARRRADTLLAQLMQRIPELEAPPQAQEPPETVEEEPEREEPRPDRTEAQEGVQRPWWRRMFGR